MIFVVATSHFALDVEKADVMDAFSQSTNKEEVRNVFGMPPDELLDAIRDGESHESLEESLLGWQLESTALRLGQFAERVMELVEGTGNPRPTVVVEHGGLRLSTARWAKNKRGSQLTRQLLLLGVIRFRSQSNGIAALSLFRSPKSIPSTFGSPKSK